MITMTTTTITTTIIIIIIIIITTYIALIQPCSKRFTEIGEKKSYMLLCV